LPVTSAATSARQPAAARRRPPPAHEANPNQAAAPGPCSTRPAKQVGCSCFQAPDQRRGSCRQWAGLAVVDAPAGALSPKRPGRARITKRLGRHRRPTQFRGRAAHHRDRSLVARWQAWARAARCRRGPARRPAPASAAKAWSSSQHHMVGECCQPLGPPASKQPAGQGRL